VRLLVFLFGFFDAFDLFNSRELCWRYGVLHPKDTMDIDLSPRMLAVIILAVVALFGLLFYFVGHARRFW